MEGATSDQDPAAGCESPTRSLPACAWRVLRHEGFRSFSFKLLDALGYRRLLRFERTLADPIRSIQALPPVAIRRLQLQDVGAYLEFRPQSDPQTIRDRLAGGQACFVACRQGRIVGCSWTATDRARLEFLDREVRLGDGEVYVFDTFTKMECRGQQISPALSTEMYRQFHAAGFRRAIRVVWAANTKAIRSLAKTDHRLVGALGYWKLGSRRIDFGHVGRKERTG